MRKRDAKRETNARKTGRRRATHILPDMRIHRSSTHLTGRHTATRVAIRATILIAGLLLVGGCESTRAPTAVDSPAPSVPASPAPPSGAGQETRFLDERELDDVSTDTASSPLKVASFRVIRYPVDRGGVRYAPLLELHDVATDSARVLGIRFDIGGRSTGWCLISLSPHAQGVPYAPGERAYLFGVNDRDPWLDDPVVFFSIADIARTDASARVLVQDRAGALTALTASTHIEVLSAKPVLPPPRAPFWFGGDTCGR